MAEETQEKQTKKSNSLVIIIIAVVLILLLAIGGVIGYLILGGNDQPAMVQDNQAQTQGGKNASLKRSTDYMNMGPVYPMDQFIVNLLSDSGSRFLKTRIDLELSTESLMPEIEKKKPLIRDIIIRTLSSKTFEEVSTMKGKDRLKDEIVDRINEVLADGHLKNIYFTDFVVQ